MKALLVSESKVGMCMNSVTSILINNGIRPLAAIDDALVVTVNEPLAYIDDKHADAVNSLMGKLNAALTISTALAVVRMTTGLRAYAYSSGVKLGDAASITPIIIGGGGIIDDLGVVNANAPIPVIKEFSTRDLSGNLIILKHTGPLSDLINKLTSLYASGYSGQVIIEVDLKSILRRRRIFKRLSLLVIGVVLSNIPELCKLSLVDVNRLVSIERCRKCWVDYIGADKIKTCPLCGSRLVELIRGEDKIKILKPEVLEIKVKAMLKESKPIRPLILPSSWFTGKRTT